MSSLLVFFFLWTSHQSFSKGVLVDEILVIQTWVRVTCHTFRFSLVTRQSMNFWAWAQMSMVMVTGNCRIRIYSTSECVVIWVLVNILVNFVTSDLNTSMCSNSSKNSSDLCADSSWRVNLIISNFFIVCFKWTCQNWLVTLYFNNRRSVSMANRVLVLTH